MKDTHHAPVGEHHKKLILQARKLKQPFRALELEPITGFKACGVGIMLAFLYRDGYLTRELRTIRDKKGFKQRTSFYAITQKGQGLIEEIKKEKKQ